LAADRPAAKIVAVEPHPASCAILQRNTAHNPEDRLLLVSAAITKDSGTTLLSASVSHRRVGEDLPSLWADVEDRPGDFGVEVPSLTITDLWEMLSAFGIQQVDLLKLDCEGAENVVLPELNRLGLMNQVGWIRS
jgi:FkbM family methyltransferase